MTLTEARQECLRYLNYLKREEAKSIALGKLAAAIKVLLKATTLQIFDGTGEQP